TPAGRVLALLPVFSGFRTALRWISFTHLALAVLAARGWDVLAGSRRARVVCAGALAAWAVACGALALRATEVAARVERLPFAAEHLRNGDCAAADPARILGTACRAGAVRAAAAAGTLALAAGMSPAVAGAL